MHKGPSIKDVRNQGGSSDVDIRTFWRKKFGLFEIYGVSARTRGRVEPVRTRGRRLSQCGHFADKGEEGQFFAIL